MTASGPLVLIIAAGVLAGGPALGGPVPILVALVVAAVGVLHAVWLGRLGLEIHDRRFDRRGVALLAGGVLLAAASAAAVPMSPLLNWLALAAGGLVTVGLLGLPGVAPTGRAALRRGLDGLCVAMWKFVVIWLLVLEPRGGLSPLAFVTCLLACVGITVAVVSGVRAPYPRKAALTVAGGAAAMVFGLAVLPLLPDGGPPRDAWLLGAAAALILGTVLVWAGASVAVPGPAEPPPSGPPVISDGTLVGDPLLVAPVLAGLAAIGYAFVSAGRLGNTGLALAAAAVAAVLVRETLEVLQVRRFAGQLAVQEAHFRSLVAGSADVIIVLEPDLTVRWQSPAAARQFGLSDQEVVGRPFTALVHPDDLDRVAGRLADIGTGDGASALVQAQVCDGFGVWRPAEFTVNNLADSPDGGALVVHLRDVSERQELENALHRTVRTDPLTGVVNRAALQEAMAAPGTNGTLLTIGLDGLGGINDAHGPEIGDAMLVEVARRIRATIGPDDVAARLSGDEFAVHTTADRIPAYTLATRLVGELGESYRLPGTVLHLAAGIGMAGAAGTDADEVLRRAGLALRRAKRAGRGRVEWHDDDVEAAYVRRALLEQHLPEAVCQGQFDLAYQAVYDLVEGNPVGVEALLRWRHPTLGTVLPLETLAVARELGLTGQIHDWVLNRACRQLSRWQHEGHDLWLSINVCFDDLLAPGFAAGLSLALDSHQIEPSDLVIELAERDLDGSWERTIAPLTTVREFGVRTALDGFGTGATSLAHLRRLPADLLKVDRSLFVEPAGSTAPVTPIIDAVVELGNRLDVTVIAQGIESQADVELVRGAGCRYGQGHRYGQPAPPERIEAELTAVT